MRLKRHGFTLVEIMIVIAVIAILAAVTIVGYRGITQRAEAAAYSTVADQAEKLLRIEYGRTHRIPYKLKPGGGAFDTEKTCLVKNAAALPETEEFPAGVCWITTYSDNSIAPEYISYNPVLMDQFSSATKKDLPVKPLVTASLNYDISLSDYLVSTDISSTTKTRGIVYTAQYHVSSLVGEDWVGSGPMFASLLWVAPQKQDCGRGEASLGGGLAQKEAHSYIKMIEEGLENNYWTEDEREDIIHSLAFWKTLAAAEDATKSSLCERVYNPVDTSDW